MTVFSFEIVIEKNDFKEKFEKVKEMITKIFDEATKKYKNISYEGFYEGLEPLEFTSHRLDSEGIRIDYEFPLKYKDNIVINFYYNKADYKPLWDNGILEEWFRAIIKLKPIEIVGGINPKFMRYETFCYVRDFETFLKGTITEIWEYDINCKLIKGWKKHIIGNKKLIEKIKDFLIKEKVIQQDGSLIFITYSSQDVNGHISIVWFNIMYKF